MGAGGQRTRSPGRPLCRRSDRRHPQGITTYPLFAPLVVDRIETAQDLRRQSVVADALARADNLDIAIVSIGASRAKESAVWEKASPAMRRACEEAGAVAEFSGLFIGETGAPVSTPLDGRVIGVSLQQLKAAQQVIGFATGVDRADAVRAAASSSIFSSLVIDVDLANALMSPSS